MTSEANIDLACVECGMTYCLEDDREPSDYCHSCVYDVLDRLTEERDALRVILAIYELGAEALPAERAQLRELREAAEALAAEWRRKAKELRNYDVGMHEVVNCANELEAVLAKVTP